jgi:hypothetical protein
MVAQKPKEIQSYKAVIKSEKKDELLENLKKVGIHEDQMLVTPNANNRKEFVVELYDIALEQRQKSIFTGKNYLPFGRYLAYTGFKYKTAEKVVDKSEAAGAVVEEKSAPVESGNVVSGRWGKPKCNTMFSNEDYMNNLFIREVPNRFIGERYVNALEILINKSKVLTSKFTDSPVRAVMVNDMHSHGNKLLLIGVVSNAIAPEDEAILKEAGYKKIAKGSLEKELAKRGTSAEEAMDFINKNIMKKKKVEYVSTGK